MSELSSKLGLAANLIRAADALIITAGAGMGVDSGLPDFRGKDGFWKAYPALAAAGLSFSEIANPVQFEINPKRAWGFYGHRLNLYRNVEPHEGFQILKAWLNKKSAGGFVVTSNVDGQFQKAGFEAANLFEIHGSIHHIQCTHPRCHSGIWSADKLEVKVDEANCLAVSALPVCHYCSKLARPNILMFDDDGWNGSRTFKQQASFKRWVETRREANQKVVIIEIGAGLDVATIRWMSESLPYSVIRINPRDCELPRHKAGVSLELVGLEAVQRINRLLGRFF